MTTTPAPTGRDTDTTRSRATAYALEALRCEQELIECGHDERGELLLDAATNWFDAGHVERAIELFTEARLYGGDAGRTAQLHLARIAFHRGDRDEALGTLRGLAGAAELDLFDLVGGGDLLRENGEPEEAVGWYDRVLAGRTPRDVTRSDCPWVVRTALAGRSRARADLGLPPDPLDRTAPTLPALAPTTTASATASDPSTPKRGAAGPTETAVLDLPTGRRDTPNHRSADRPEPGVLDPSAARRGVTKRQVEGDDVPLREAS